MVADADGAAVVSDDRDGVEEPCHEGGFSDAGYPGFLKYCANFLTL